MEKNPSVQDFLELSKKLKQNVKIMNEKLENIEKNLLIQEKDH